MPISAKYKSTGYFLLAGMIVAICAGCENKQKDDFEICKMQLSDLSKMEMQPETCMKNMGYIKKNSCEQSKIECYEKNSWINNFFARVFK